MSAGRNKRATGGGKERTGREAQWHELVATAAYLRAEARGFVGGSPEDDWFAAEAELRETLRSDDKR
ncbi:MAG: DUF2934 domain-containing protein [Burkholderiales bacterium]